MQICDYTDGRCCFTRINPGDVFYGVESGDYYIKMRRCILTDDTAYNVIRLRDGMFDRFNSNDPVIMYNQDDIKLVIGDEEKGW